MKRIIKNILGCVVTITMIVVMVVYLGHLTRPVEVDRCINAIETFHDIPEDSIEVIAYGSSHTWFGVNPIEMYEKYGIGAYNYGCNWQRINTTHLFVDDSFKTQKPKVVLIETYRVGNWLEDTIVNGEVWYTKSIPESETKQEYLKQCFGDDKEKWLSYYMPLGAFHQNWGGITSKSFMLNSDTMDFSKTMGWWNNEKIVEVDIPDQSIVDQEELKAGSIEILDKIVTLCKKNDVEVIFYTVPWAGTFEYSDALTTYAQENDCVYINLFEKIDDIGIDGSTDFCDAGHLNTSGATKVANYLGAYLAENYELTDMRTVENNIWEQALE